jgi:hypothetical protein
MFFCLSSFRAADDKNNHIPGSDGYICLLRNKERNTILRCYFDQQFQIIFLSVVLSSPPPHVHHSTSPFFLSQDLIHSINKAARSGIK